MPIPVRGPAGRRVRRAPRDRLVSLPAASGPAPARLLAGNAASRDYRAVVKRSIFVAIASYADPELPRTLGDAVGTARFPDRLRFGICWQADPQRPLALDAFRRDARFRFDDTTTHASQGGPWARNRAQSLWRGEPYTLQVDSHMKFEPEWDSKLIDMLESMPGAKPLLTMNAPLFHYDDDGVLHRRHDMGVPTTTMREWGPPAWAPWLDFGPPNTRNPARARFVNGGFAFTRGQWNVEVPQDPDHYYWGEEFSVTVRSFTWGYDLFLPSEVVAWHMDHRRGPPRRHWEHGPAVVQARNAVACERLHRLVYSGEAESLVPYGLGHVRSLRDYEIYAGFDLARRRAHPDVYTGVAPDPVTIRSPADWDLCLSWEEARQRFDPTAAGR
jgi:hypothetical protein